MVKCLETEYDRQWYEEAPIDTLKVRITEELITECLNQQIATGEEGRYARMVKLDINVITSLKLEYKSISIIDNLNNLVLLTKLQLCNNVITKIENLEELVNLTWLDLSFNSIRKIEGLDTLKKIEVLDLHRNFITKLENMDNLLRLEIFFIATNKLDDYENVRYLRRFVRLRSATFAGNPISKNPNFFPYLIAFVPQLYYVDCKVVASSEREIADAKYQAQVDHLKNTEDKLIRRASVVEAEEEVLMLHKNAFVDGFLEDVFWDALFDEDPEGQGVMMLQDTEDIQAVYKELFRNTTGSMFEVGMKYYEKRCNEQRAYDIAISEELEIYQKNANMLTEEFVEYGRTATRDIKILTTLIEDAQGKLQHGEIKELPEEISDFQTQLNEMTREYVKKLHDLWELLINNEIEFNENYEDTNDLLDRSMNEIVGDWMEHLRAQFASLRDVEQQLFERLIESLVTYGEFRSDDTTIPAIMKDIVRDKDQLQNYLQISHDRHIAVVDSREDQHSRQIKEYLETLSIGSQIKEYQRSTARLQEISHFTNTHIEYLEDTKALIFCTEYIPPVRTDQEATEEEEEQPLPWYTRLTKRLRLKEKKFIAMMNPTKIKKEVFHKEEEDDKLSFML